MNHVSLAVFGILLFLALVITLPLASKPLHQSQNITKSLEQTTSSQPVGQSGSWDMIFNDEFNGTTLDTTKWVTCYPWSSSDNGCDHGNGELQWYLPKNVIPSNGILKLRAQKETYRAPDGKTYSYTSGMISTGRNKWATSMPAKFTYQYGYAEIRAKVPRGKGLWPAFWMITFSNTDPGEYLPEIDAMEILGQDTTTTYMNYHWLETNGTSEGIYTGPDFSADYHTYAVDWRPDAIIWYVDGIERHRYTDTANIANQPHYIIANLAVGGDWPGNPDASTPFPSDYEIDYVRVWKKTANAPTPTPTATRSDSLR